MPNRPTYEELECKVKELERKLRFSLRRLEESEQLHETLIERNLHPVAIIDAEGRYLDANRAFLDFIQTEKERLPTMAVFDFAPPGKRPKQETNHRPVWETGGTLETALEGIWITDKKGLTTYVNHEVEALLGYSLEEMIGKRMSDFLSHGDGEACEVNDPGC